MVEESQDVEMREQSTPACQEEEKKGESLAASVLGGEETKKGGRQPHHRDMKAGTTDATVERQYEAGVRDAASILVCNYSALNMAISMGFAGRQQIASDRNED